MIKAPFNFVPLSDKVYFPDWADQISHDIPFEDGEDGVITLEITNNTPLFVRDGHSKDETTEWSNHIITPQGDKVYFIPGTTLKGCFRNVMEVLAFAKMNRFNNSSFGYRSFLRGSHYPGMMASKAKHCGWLYRDGDGYAIDECVEGIQKIAHNVLKDYFPTFNKGKEHATAEIKQKSLGEDLYPLLTIYDNQISYSENGSRKTVPAGTFRVVCTGYMNGKKSEYLFSEICNTIQVDKAVFDSFDTIHGFTPYYAGQNGKDGFLRERLKRGERIPVFFEKQEEKVVAMGITRMFRYPFKKSLKDCVERVSKEHFDSRLDLTESIFGYVSSSAQLRGRVQIGDAFSTKLIADEDCVSLSGVFGQPRPSYYPLYLKQDGNTISDYSSDNAQLSGRKRYRITQGGKVWALSQGNGNEKLMTSFRPLPANQTFICKIHVHNLRKIEIGALLSAFSFNGASNAYHNIGLAKSYGYGTFTCKATLSGEFKHTAIDYIKSFNEEISYFLQQHNSSIDNEKCLSRLLAIASATHTEEEMQQMNFAECNEYKVEPSILKEKPVAYPIPINEKEILKSKLQENAKHEFELYKLLPEEEAIEKLDELKFRLTGKDMDSLLKDIQIEIDQIKSSIAKRKDEAKQTADAERQRIIAENAERRLNVGLSFLLERKVNSDDLKIDLLGNGIKRIKDFLKKNKEYTLSDSDKAAIREWIAQLPRPTKKADLKDLESFESNSWKAITSFIGEPEAMLAYNKLNKE